jgi:hypothetical protein
MIEALSNNHFPDHETWKKRKWIEHTNSFAPTNGKSTMQLVSSAYIVQKHINWTKSTRQWRKKAPFTCS